LAIIRKQASYAINIRAEESEEALNTDCSSGEHNWQVIDRFGIPQIWRCQNCGVCGYIRRKKGFHRNGRMVIYQCSTKNCTKPGVIRSKLRGTGGAFDWACCDAHAKGPKFAPRAANG